MQGINRDWLFKIEVQAGRQSTETINEAIRLLQRMREDREARPVITPHKSREVVRREQNGYMTLQLEKVNCGKATCKKCQSGPAHGPYWYAYWKEGGKTRSKYIGKQLEGADLIQPDQR